MKNELAHAQRFKSTFWLALSAVGMHGRTQKYVLTLDTRCKSCPNISLTGYGLVSRAARIFSYLMTKAATKPENWYRDPGTLVPVSVSVSIETLVPTLKLQQNQKLGTKNPFLNKSHPKCTDQHKILL